MKTAVQVRVDRPQGPQSPPRPHPHPARLRARPYYRRWSPWLVSAAAVACVVVFILTMYVNDCQRRDAGDCTANFLGRFAFQPLKENPLLGPSSATLLKMGALDVSKVVHGRQGWHLIYVYLASCWSCSFTHQCAMPYIYWYST